MGLYTDEIVGYRTAIVIFNTPEGKEQIQLVGAAYILDFHTSLVCLQKLNNKSVF